MTGGGLRGDDASIMFKNQPFVIAFLQATVFISSGIYLVLYIQNLVSP
jgi:hypothetical protein